jgi:ribose transport system permease protein
VSTFETRLRRKERVLGTLEQFGISLVALLLFVLFSVLSSKFSSVNNIFNIIKQVSIVAILSIGMSFVFLIGGMDLSAGSNVFLSAVITATLLVEGWPVWLAMLAAVAACMLTGLFNGLFIEKFRINCVIVTLGSQLAIRGLALTLISLNNQWIYVKDPVTKFINIGKVFGLPMLLYVIIALYLFGYLVLNHTSYGKQVYAVGGNERAAGLCGLNTIKVKALCYMICGLTAGLAGVITASRLGMVSTTVGLGMEFDAVTAVVLGGALLQGGEGSVVKTLIGAVIVAMIANFMTLYGINENFQDAVTGAFILFAVLFNRMTQRDLV